LPKEKSLREKQRTEKEIIPTNPKPSVSFNKELAVDDTSSQPLIQPSPTSSRLGDILLKYFGPDYVKCSSMISVDEVKPD
jgi:hypothetical protein